VARLAAQSALPGLDDLADGFVEADADIPCGVVGAHFPEVAVIANVVADATLGDVGVALFFAAEFFGQREGFQYRTGVGFAAADIIDLPNPRRGEELLDEAADVEGVDVVADLFAFVAEDFVFAPLEVAFDQVAEKAVQLDAAVVGPGKAAAAQTTGGHSEVASVFLDHNVGGDFGSAEERVFGLVDGEGLGDAVLVGGISVVPSGLEFAQREVVGGVAIDFVRAHVDEGRLGTGAAGGLEKIHGADRVGVKVVKGNASSSVMAGLGGGMDDGIGFEPGNEVENALTIPDVELVMGEVFQLGGEAVLIPAGIALLAEEDGALVVVHAVDVPAELVEVDADFAADEAGGTGDEEGGHREKVGRWEGGKVRK
jgi:hypothetical protein